MAVIGYPLNTQSHNDSGRHLIGRNHTASHRSRMSIGCTRLWLNKSSTCTRLAYKPPDYGRTTRPPAHTLTRTRSGRELEPRHEAGHCLFLRLGALFFPEIFFRSSFLWTLKSQLGHFLRSRIPPDRQSKTALFDWTFFRLDSPGPSSYRRSSRF